MLGVRDDVRIGDQPQAIRALDGEAAAGAFPVRLVLPRHEIWHVGGRPLASAQRAVGGGGQWRVRRERRTVRLGSDAEDFDDGGQRPVRRVARRAQHVFLRWCRAVVARRPQRARCRWLQPPTRCCGVLLLWAGRTPSSGAAESPARRLRSQPHTRHHQRQRWCIDSVPRRWAALGWTAALAPGRPRRERHSQRSYKADVTHGRDTGASSRRHRAD